MSDSPLTDQHDDLRRSPEYAVHEMMDQVRYQFRRRMAETATTQAALAGEMGVSASVVSRLLRAAENTSLLTVARAARALGLTFRAIKFVPDEHADLQVDEFATLLGTEGSGRGWWSRTQKPGAFAWRHAPEAFAGVAYANPAVPSADSPDRLSYHLDPSVALDAPADVAEFS